MDTTMQQEGFVQVITSYVPRRYLRGVGLTLIALLILVGGLMGYRWRLQRREAEAQLVFSQAFAKFEQALEQDTPAAWQAATAALRAGHEKVIGSDLAPHLLSLQVDAALRQDKLAEARELMATTIDELPSSSPLYYLFRLKYALMQLDASDKKVVQEGVEELQALTGDADTYHAEVAGYYLGAYYASVGDYQQTEVAWRDLVGTVEPNYAKSSPWVRLAETRLETL